jgi:hypothetical protein
MFVMAEVERLRARCAEHQLWLDDDGDCVRCRARLGQRRTLQRLLGLAALASAFLFGWYLGRGAAVAPAAAAMTAAMAQLPTVQVPITQAPASEEPRFDQHAVYARSAWEPPSWFVDQEPPAVVVVEQASPPAAAVVAVAEPAPPPAEVVFIVGQGTPRAHEPSVQRAYARAPVGGPALRHRPWRSRRRPRQRTASYQPQRAPALQPARHHAGGTPIAVRPAKRRRR